MDIEKNIVSMIYKYVNNGSLLKAEKLSTLFLLSASHFINEILNSLCKNWHQWIKRKLQNMEYVFMIWAKLCFTSLILVIFCFTDFDCLRNKGFSNAIPTGTFTNISNKNMKGSRTYDHIWLTKETKNITSGNDPILPNFKIYFFKFSWVESNISIRWKCLLM